MDAWRQVNIAILNFNAVIAFGSKDANNVFKNNSIIQNEELIASKFMLDNHGDIPDGYCTGNIPYGYHPEAMVKKCIGVSCTESVLAAMVSTRQ